MVSRFAVHFEDGHVEEVRANECQYVPPAGLIIQQRTTTKGDTRPNLQTGRMEQELDVKVELRLVLAPPRADMPPSLRWHRIESLPPIDDEGEQEQPQQQSNGSVPPVLEVLPK